MIVGLTGGIGAGKSTATDLFSALGIDIVDADVIARSIVTPNSMTLNKLTETFGVDILLQNGELNRQALRELVFKDATKKQQLEDITHPTIQKKIREQLNNVTDKPYKILSSPLLLEKSQDQWVDHTIVVDVPVDVQISRATSRDRQSVPQIQAIINTQMDRSQRLKKADFIIDNSKDLNYTKRQVDQIHAQLITLAGKQ